MLAGSMIMPGRGSGNKAICYAAMGRKLHESVERLPRKKGFGR